MSSARVENEHAFACITNIWQSLLFKKKCRMWANQLGKDWSVCVLFTNALTCMEGGNQVSDAFMLTPPHIDEYFTD